MSDSDEEFKDQIPKGNFRSKSSLKQARPAKKQRKIRFEIDKHSDPDTSNESETSSESSQEEHRSGPRKIDNFEWDLPATFLLLGKPRSGKSYMTKYLLYLFTTLGGVPKDKQFQWITVFTGSKWNNEFKGQIPDNYIFEINPDTFQDKLKKYVQGLEREVERNGSVQPNALVLDDIVGLLDSNDSFFTHFISTYRKLNMSVFICCQYLMKNVSPTVRECLRYTLAFGSATQRTVEALFETCGQDFENKKEFKEKFREITKAPYSAMLFNAYENDPNNNYLRITAPKDLPDEMLHFNPQPIKKSKAKTKPQPQQQPNAQQQGIAGNKFNPIANNYSE